MTQKIFPPPRQVPIVDREGLQSRELATFFDDIRRISDSMANQTNAGSIASPNATAAPASYNQTQVQGIVTLANDTRAVVNSLVTAFNTLLASLQSTGRMDAP